MSGIATAQIPKALEFRMLTPSLEKYPFYITAFWLSNYRKGYFLLEALLRASNKYDPIMKSA